MFFLRCAFWLTIVYASMSWTRDELASGDWARPAAASGAIAGLLAGRSEAGVADWCRRQPARCLADAERLTALVGDVASGREDAPSGTSRIPLPVPDPRRRAREAIQTPPR